MPQPYPPRSPYSGPPPVPAGPASPRTTRRPPVGSGAGGRRAPSQERLVAVGRVPGAPPGGSPRPSPARARPLPPGPGPLDERGRRLEPKARPGRGSSRESAPSSSSSPRPARRAPLRADHSLGGKGPPSSTSSSSSSSSSSPPSRRRAGGGVPPADPCASLQQPRELQECLRRLSAARLRRSPSLGRLPAPAPPSVKRSSSLRGLRQDPEEPGPPGPAPRPVQLDILPGPSTGTRQGTGGSSGPGHGQDHSWQSRLQEQQQQQQHRPQKQEVVTVGTGLVGLRNLGNTCLSNTQGLRDYCLRREYLREGNVCGKRNCELMDAFSSLIATLWEASSSSSANPIHFQQKFQRLVPHFAGYSQQDAQEFLRFLMDWLHVEINRKPHKTPNIMSLSGSRAPPDSMERLR
ncbi:ubiquitin carboxyl-terminal hydrolase 21-like isoform X2 [Hemiscyllium ocellatum]|uniref:ubiquitin carboxyl-terminal hydrolase 21-like isoform X2 n=1 Tax=Hemiscyllium ocellatum TaxID=170820 RepID=UPI002966FD66|nr:ubiquitin carboxyl-terminal hydrolase 21-like isoform X2 [Hemiscyllium ocellatum]